MKIGSLPVITGLFALSLFITPTKAQDAHTDYVISKITIPDAIQIAEQYLGKKKLDTSGHVITSVRYHPHHQMQTRDKAEIKNSAGPCWQVTYTLKKLSLGGEYFVFVFEDGSIGLMSGI